MRVNNSNTKKQELSYHSAIIIPPEFPTYGTDYSSYLDRMDKLWNRIFDAIESVGSLWVLASNAYSNGELLPIPLDIEDRIKTITNFKSKNILVVYKKSSEMEKPFFTAYYNILLFVKSLDDYYFDKDTIREPHIFKNIEWGKRTVGSSGYNNKMNIRYSEKGRDPGNVLYKADRDKEGKILRIHEYTREEILEKIVKLSTKKGWKIASNISDPRFIKLLSRLERHVVKVEI